MDKPCGICGQPGFSSGLCERDGYRRWKSGLDTAAFLATWNPTCAIRGCGQPSTDLDHDHSCCHRSYAKGEFSRYRRAPVPFGNSARRCGGCNRAWLCRSCNSDVAVVERGNGERLPPERESALLDYLLERMT